MSASERRTLEPPPLEPLLAEVLDLVEGGAATVDRIAVDCGIEAGEAAVALARLELLGYVSAGPGRRVRAEGRAASA